MHDSSRLVDCITDVKVEAQRALSRFLHQEMRNVGVKRRVLRGRHVYREARFSAASILEVNT